VAVTVAPAVPFYGLQARFGGDADEIRAALAAALRSPKPILGERVAALEAAVRERTGARHAVGVASGTGALQVALASLGVGPGTEVIVPAFSYHSPASCAMHLGATVRLVDVDPETATIDPERAAAALGERTRAVVAVHLFSIMADLATVRAAMRGHGAALLEDSAIAIGMRRDGRPAGLGGDLGIYSFHPVKLLAGIGDAGMVVTDDERLGTTARMLRNHGQDGRQRFVHQLVGFNCRMDEVVAAFLLRRLVTLDAAVQRRARIAAGYHEGLAGLPLRLPPEVGYQRTFYTYVVRSSRRDQLRAFLLDQGIETRVYYPHPLHLEPAFASLGEPRGAFPNAEAWSREALGLPLYPELGDEQVEAVIEAVRAFHG
jgi:UDP-2-acetamido-2-deoxy-ribo-hexuluronate aminotransferase